jgi:hypothetical protein
MPPAPKHTRRWFQFGAGAILLAVAIAGLLAWIARPRHFPDPRKGIKDVEVEIYVGDSGDSPFRFRLVDPTFIRSAVVRPMDDSERDPTPKRYIVLGSIYVHYDDATTDSAVLFLPWGCWKHEEGNYRKSDLSQLRDESRRLLQASRPTAPMLGQPWFWSPKPYD